MRMSQLTVGVVAVALLSIASAQAAKCAEPMRAARPSQDSRALARSIFQELVEINTTDTPAGNVTTAAVAMQKRLLAAGYPAGDMALLGPNERKQNLVVRLHGSGARKPVLLIGHLDVVEARREDWTTDPFKFVEKDGYFYGRGTQDMKDGDAILVASMIRLKQSGFHPNRDIILALTADEEGGSSNGVEWLLKNHRDLVDAEYVINQDGYSIVTEHGKPLFYELDGTEKGYADFQLLVTNAGGHSSLPVPDNAIYELTSALARIQKFEFPFELNSVTRGYYEQMATIETGQRAADMKAILRDPPDSKAIARLSRETADHSRIHTTCVPTRLAGGHANNALPQRATAVINCRILPGHSPEEVRQQLVKAINDPHITVGWLDEKDQAQDKAPDRKGYPPPPLNPDLIKPLEALVAADWPGLHLKIVPNMSNGASDGAFTSIVGMPTYTITGITNDRDNERLHGRDERLLVDSFYKGNEFLYEYIQAISN
jgi:acetylornithine deacetylase/succinyl-diaminopimelate desuccinylase-like protein